MQLSIQHVIKMNIIKKSTHTTANTQLDLQFTMFNKD